MVHIDGFDPSEYDLGFGEGEPDQLGTEEFDEALSQLIKSLLEDEKIRRLIIEAFAPDIIKEEAASQRELIEQEHYEAAILRQAAFLETYVTLELKEKMKSIKGSGLTDTDERALTDWAGNKQKVVLARMLGLLDEEEDESPKEGEGRSQVYITIMKKRNELAHNWWHLIPDNERKEYERQSKKFLEILEESVEEEF